MEGTSWGSVVGPCYTVTLDAKGKPKAVPWGPYNSFEHYLTDHTRPNEHLPNRCKAWESTEEKILASMISCLPLPNPGELFLLSKPELSLDTVLVDDTGRVTGLTN